MALFGEDDADSELQVEQSEVESAQQENVAKDISNIAYPVVLGIGVIISAFLFLLL